MSLKTIKKLIFSSYNSPNDFKKDVMLIYSNCEDYNGNDSDYTKKAIKLLNFFNER